MTPLRADTHTQTATAAKEPLSKERSLRPTRRWTRRKSLKNPSSGHALLLRGSTRAGAFALRDPTRVTEDDAGVNI
jgi:hypothetical protein